MDGYFQDEALSEELEEEQHADADAAQDDELMTIVDPLIDKASTERDDSAQDDDLDDSEFDDDVQFDELDEFMSDDPDEVDDLVALDDDPELGDVVMDAEMDGDLESELKVPLTASQQALEARRAIEARAEARRMERDLNYLDFELDD